MRDAPERQLFEMIVSADRAGANLLADEWGGTHGYDHAVIELLEPALRLLAQREHVSLAEGYVAAKIAEDMLEKAAGARSGSLDDREAPGPVVLGNIEDDYHALGRRMVAIFLRASGWRVHELGNDVLPEAFVDAAIELEARVIGASAMLYTTAMNIRKLRDEIDRRGLTGSLQLAVGGAVFNLRPELIDEVGGDGTATTALDAPDLMAGLWAKATEEAQP